MALKNFNERLYRDLQNPEIAAAYVKLAREEGMQAFLLALRDVNIARNGGMTRTALKCGRDRRSLYRALSSKGKPSFDTVERALKSAGLDIVFVPREESGSEDEDATVEPAAISNSSS